MVKEPFFGFNIFRWKTWFETFFSTHLTLLHGPLQAPPLQKLCDLYFLSFSGSEYPCGIASNDGDYSVHAYPGEFTMYRDETLDMRGLATLWLDSLLEGVFREAWVSSSCCDTSLMKQYQNDK
jgi:hypothetical protein